MDRSTWEDIQTAEIEYHLRKDKDHILEFNIPYWTSMMDKVREHTEITEDTRILEVGCGCCGVLMSIDTGVLVGVDPLMDQYIENFEHLRDARPTWVNATAEEMAFDEPFDIVINVNSLDHMFDPQLAVRQFDKFLKPGGLMVLSLNCHNTNFFRAYMKRLYWAIDRYHPFQFRPQDVLEMVPEGYEQLMLEDIDDLYLPIQDAYVAKVLKRKGIRWDKVFVYIFNPFKWPVGLVRVLGGWQVHRKKPGQKAIYSNYMFILRKPS